MVKVAIVEDEPIIRKALHYLIDWTSIGCFIVGEAENGVDGLAMIRNSEPDLLLVDINLPKMSGMEMLEQIHDSQGCESIIISGYSEFDYARKALKLRVIDYIVKPIDVAALTDAIKKAVTIIRRRQEASLEQVRPGGAAYQYDRLLHAASNYRVQKALAFIAERYADSVSIACAAREFGVSVSYLSRLLKKHTGKTFNGLLNICRVQKAVAIMSETRNATIRYVSDTVGYTELKYFSQVFKRITGMSPSAFQKQLSQDR